MRCLIVDDEAPARQEMRLLLESQPDVVVVGEAGTVREALEETARHQPEVVFLDIQLRGESGFDYVAQLGSEPVKIVFVTAHGKHAVRAFECNALDYLLKPVHPGRLGEALRRIRALQPILRRAEEDDMVFLKGAAVARFVPWREVVRIASEGNYSRVHLGDGTSMLMLRSLKDWVALAPVALFVQVHRTAIVRRNAIRELLAVAGGQRTITMVDGARVPVGRSFWSGLKEWAGAE